MDNELFCVYILDNQDSYKLEEWARINCNGFLGTFTSSSGPNKDMDTLEFIFDNERDLIMFKLVCG